MHPRTTAVLAAIPGAALHLVLLRAHGPLIGLIDTLTLASAIERHLLTTHPRPRRPSP